MKLEKKSFGTIQNNEVFLFTLMSDNLIVSITNIGATITDIQSRDREGNMGHIALGFDDPKMYLDEGYLKDGFYFGATVGRYANRIAGGKFKIDAKTYELEVNNGPNHLHGGSGSFSTKFWKAEPFESESRVGVKMGYTSGHMENGYPGELAVNVVFTMTEKGELIISYQAKTDRKTVLNLTNHTYFNLEGNGNVLETKVKMEASQFTPKDETNIPTGEIISVKDTPLDFTIEHKIGERVHMFADGYDHNYVINGVQGQLRKAAEAYSEKSGRSVEFMTTEPGFQFYTAHYLNGKYGRDGFSYGPYGGFCFEAQHYPDSPNRENFPTTLLLPGETYTQTTFYVFGVRK